jgi:AcrR family transcriptional regulator
MAAKPTDPRRAGAARTRAAGASGAAPRAGDVELSGATGTGTVIEATDGRVPGRRGQATRRRLLDCTAELLRDTPWRAITVTHIARRAGTSPATFYQYFENVEQALLVLAEELMAGATALAELVDGDWSPAGSWQTAVAVVEGFLDYWEQNRAVFRVVELATAEGDLRFRGLRARALNAVTVTLARVVTTASTQSPAGADPMAVASTLVSMLVHVAAHRYGFEFWGIRTKAMVDSQARVLHWAITGRPAPAGAGADLPPASLRPRTGAVLGGGAAAARTGRGRVHAHPDEDRSAPRSRSTAAAPGPKSGRAGPVSKAGGRVAATRRRSSEADAGPVGRQPRADRS